MTDGNTSWALGLRIDGKPLDAKYLKTVGSVKVLQDVDAAGSVALSVTAPKEDIFAWLDDAKVDEGSPIEVEMGTDERSDLVFAGEITGLDITFSGRLAISLSLRGYDGRHRMMRACTPQSYEKVKDSDLAKKIGQKHGLRVEATATTVEHPYLLQAKQSDYEFLRERAEANGFDVLVIGKTLHFRPVGYKAPPSLRLSAEKELLDFHAAVTSMNQPTQIKIGGWDVVNKQPIVGTANSGDLGQGSGPSRSKTVFGPALRADGEFPVSSQAEAEARARAQLLKDALGHVTAEATMHGNCAVKAGMVVTILDVGSRFSGNYYVTSAAHDFELVGSGRYQTRLTMRRTAS
jgi:phage protein D